jgi:hypothetical protein
MDTEALSRGYNAPGLKLTTHLYLVQRIRVTEGAKLQSPYMSHGVDRDFIFTLPCAIFFNHLLLSLTKV